MSVYQATYKRPDGTSARTAMFYVQFRDHLGRLQVVSAYRDEAAARDLNRRLVRLADVRAADLPVDLETRRWIGLLAPKLRDRLVRIGLVTAQQVATLRPLSELVDAWAEHLRAKGSSERHVKHVTSRARGVIRGTSAMYWNDLDPGRVEQALRREREAGNVGIRTSNFHLQAMRQFTRWAVRMGFADDEPLRSLAPMNAAVDRRRERRALSSEEISALLEATARGPARDGISGEVRDDGIPGPERALVYRVATETGLRRNEIRLLVVSDLDVHDEERASVRVRPGNAKNRREAVIPLRAGTARALARFVQHRSPDARIFACPSDWRAASALRADLAAAGIRYADDAGRVVDFHALRTTFGTSLARSGASLQVAQRLMRHSSPSLTSNIYTVLGRDDERAAIASLPEVAASKRASGARQRAERQPVVAGARKEEPPLLLDARRAAELLGIGRSTFLRCDSRGEVARAVYLGRMRRWSRLELIRWVERGCAPRETWEATK